MFTYNVTSRGVTYGVLSSQRDRAEHDEDQDKVCEDLMVDQLMAEYTNPTEIEIIFKKRERRGDRKEKSSRKKKCNRTSTFFVTELKFDWYVIVPCYLLSIAPNNMHETHGLVLLKMKKALPSGIGGLFSLMVSSESLCGRGPGGTSGRSSLSLSSLHPKKQSQSVPYVIIIY